MTLSSQWLSHKIENRIEKKRNLVYKYVFEIFWLVWKRKRKRFNNNSVCNNSICKYECIFKKMRNKSITSFENRKNKQTRKNILLLPCLICPPALYLDLQDVHSFLWLAKKYPYIRFMKQKSPSHTEDRADHSACLCAAHDKNDELLALKHIISANWYEIFFMNWIYSFDRSSLRTC